ncbi:hypothetical protein BDN70DRAFT_884799 [Pholiota conissans]|uniref:Uncharacterized protein n=1 Tax=Pholiota conissans TaxID=109636 RepID=A0A9P6CWC2_9AGAR|nr:hypothetical protein BDN70DRAFT_884799 [Pholiota conissans]
MKDPIAVGNPGLRAPETTTQNQIICLTQKYRRISDGGHARLNALRIATNMGRRGRYRMDGANGRSFLALETPSYTLPYIAHHLLTTSILISYGRKASSTSSRQREDDSKGVDENKPLNLPAPHHRGYTTTTRGHIEFIYALKEVTSVSLVVGEKCRSR